MHLPNGSQIFVESGRGSEVQVTAISNGVEPTFTAASVAGLAVGSYILITESTWGKLQNLHLRIASIDADANTFTVYNLDTSDTNQYPTGATASFVQITSWVEIPCVQDLAQDGNEQQYYNYQCLSDDREQQLPTFKSAVTITYTFAHDYTSSLYPILDKADTGGEVKALRMYVPRASEMRCYSGVLSFNNIPTTTMNEMETVSLAVALKGNFISTPSNAAA